MLLLQCVLVWTADPVPTTDGPAHKYSAWAYRDLGQEETSSLDRYFERRTSWLYANASYSYFLVRMSAWVDLDLAEKLALTLYLVTLPASFAFLVWSLGGRTLLPVMLATALSMNLLFFMGFFNFLAGLPFALLAIGLAARHARRVALTIALVCNLLLLLAFWSHVVVFGFALLSIVAVLALAGWRSFWRGIVTWLPASAAAMALFPQSAQVTSRWEYGGTLLERLWKVFSGRVGVSFDRVEIPFAAVVASLLLIWIVVYGARRVVASESRTPVVLVAIYLVLAIAVPARAGAGSFIDDRFSLFFWILALTLVRAPAGRLESIALVLAAALSIGQSAYLRDEFRAFERDFAALMSGADQIPSGRNVFVWDLEGPRGPTEVWPFSHANSQYALRLGSPNYFHYQADARHSGHFPVRYTVAGLSRYPGERDVDKVHPSWVSPFVEYAVVWRDDGSLGPILTGVLGFERMFERGRLQVYRQNPPILEDALNSLRHDSNPDRRRQLGEAILAGLGVGRLVFAEDRGVAVNLTPDRWTFGIRPAAVVVDNQGATTVQPNLGVHCHAEESELPIALFVEDGETEGRFVFKRKRAKKIELTPVPPESQRLYILWTDKAWIPAESSFNPRLLGVRLLDLELVEVPEIGTD